MVFRKKVLLCTVNGHGSFDDDMSLILYLSVQNSTSYVYEVMCRRHEAAQIFRSADIHERITVEFLGTPAHENVAVDSIEC